MVLGGDRGIMSAYHDIRRDWRRWTAAERIIGGLLCAAGAASVPVALFFGLPF